MNDLINRADAIEAIASAEPKDNEYHYYKHIAIKILSEIPSADVIKFDFSKLSSEQLHDIHRHSAKASQGEWIKTMDGNGWNEWYVLKCPFCGATIEDKNYRSWEYNFCPHCGNRVKGSDSK